jgi:hypothetical protein
MPVRRVPNSDLTYHLVSFDADGRERADDPDAAAAGGRLSAVVRAELERARTGGAPYTDVFFVSHGWKGDVPAAIEQYDRWIGAMQRCPDDMRLARERDGGWRPFIVGLHWPSQPWGDEELGSTGGAFDAMPTLPLPQLVAEYAERLGDGPEVRAALETIFLAAVEDPIPDALPAPVYEAYAVLQRAAMPSQAAGADGAAPPGEDWTPFDPEDAYQAAREETVDFGGSLPGGILSPLRQLSFWKMKQRARRFGESGGHAMLAECQRAAGDATRFHLMGHSFGCIVMSATVAGPPRAATAQPVHSLFLVQGALSLWSYCADIPHARGRAGYFHPVVAGRRVRGAVVTTQSRFDTAVGKFYPLAAKLGRQVEFDAPGALPKYGGLGAFGVQGPGADATAMKMQPVTARYGFAAGGIYNLDAEQFIRLGGGASGAHSDIARPEVAHALWEATRVPAARD